MIGRLRSSTSSGSRSSTCDIGTWRAPGIWETFHSSSLRTSTSRASASRARQADLANRGRHGLRIATMSAGRGKLGPWSAPTIPPHPSNPGRRRRARGRGRRGRRRRVVRRRRRARGGASGGKPAGPGRPRGADGSRGGAAPARGRQALARRLPGDARAEFAGGRSLQPRRARRSRPGPTGRWSASRTSRALPERRRAVSPRPRPVLERRHGRGSRGVADDAHAGARHRVRHSGGGSALSRRAAGLPTFVPGFRGPRECGPWRRRSSSPRSRGWLGGPILAPSCSTAWRSSASNGPSRRGGSSQPAAKLAPNDADALVADAIGRAEQEHPERAFSRMGPLQAVPPPAPSASTSA